MIERIRVDGFKSLSGFAISLRKGLNVLIGPNGAGKSNICQALGMFGALSEGNLTDYFLALGGTDVAFCGAGPQGKGGRKKIQLRCSGSTFGVMRKRSGETEEYDLTYSYSINLTLDSDLKISSEKITVSRKIPHLGQVPILKAVRKSRERFALNIVNRKYAGDLSTSIKGRGDTETEQRLFSTKPLDSVLLSTSYFAFAFFLVFQDIRATKTWNIDPYLAKRPSDLVEPDELLSDGRRLPSAIHKLFNSKGDELNQINEFMKNILPTFGSLKPINPKELPTRSFGIVDSRGFTCPASGLSDGTVKLLGLLVGILRSKNRLTIVEEPENYLHPWAAQSLIEFLRAHLKDSITVLTTHSETVLNAVHPGEIIVVENEDGKTNAKRLVSRVKLVNAIRRSGFGPGHHYVAGSIGGVPL